MKKPRPRSAHCRLKRGVERGRSDEQTGIPTPYLFVRCGGLFSLQYLFNIPLRSACTAAGLVISLGVPTVSSHRFRHTVGTQVLRDCQAVLGPGATLAGPYAEALRTSGLSTEEMDWLKRTSSRLS